MLTKRTVVVVVVVVVLGVLVQRHAHVVAVARSVGGVAYQARLVKG